MVDAGLVQTNTFTSSKQSLLRNSQKRSNLRPHCSKIRQIKKLFSLSFFRVFNHSRLCLFECRIEVWRVSFSFFCFPFCAPVSPSFLDEIHFSAFSYDSAAFPAIEQCLTKKVCFLGLCPCHESLLPKQLLRQSWFFNVVPEDVKPSP